VNSPVSLAATRRIEFEGVVDCDARALGQLRLRGRLAAPGRQAAVVDIDTGATAPQWPLRLDGATLEVAAPPARGVLLRSGEQEWSLPDAVLFLHVDFGAESTAAIAPRPVPWRRRLFWSVLLAVLRTQAGRRWVSRRYGV
jgi:hypothetical protein